MYDWCFYINGETKEWRGWKDIVPAYAVDSKASYAEVIVPTIDSIRMKYLMKMLINNKKHVLCPGPTGVGKTINILELLNLEMEETTMCIPVGFSAQSSANQTQNAIDEKLEKRRKGVTGPPPGSRFVIFVDDLNMPKKEEYGAQPPLELIRQWMDHSGWYERKSKEKQFVKIEDVIFVSAMGPPGGGRSKITMRLQRHYNMITYTNIGRESIEIMFKTIMRHFLGMFDPSVQAEIDHIVDASQDVFIKVGEALRPRPATSHYLFNLRDISKIIQGVCAADRQSCVSKLDLVKIWFHENMRVFGDRLVST